MKIKGSIKSNNLNDEIFIHSIDIDCIDGTSANIVLAHLESCKPSEPNYYSIDQRIDSIEIDDEDYGEYEDNNIYSTLLNSGVFNIDLECKNDSNLLLKSLVLEFDNGSVIVLEVNDANINIVK